MAENVRFLWLRLRQHGIYLAGSLLLVLWLQGRLFICPISLLLQLKKLLLLHIYISKCKNYDDTGRANVGCGLAAESNR